MELVGSLAAGSRLSLTMGVSAELRLKDVKAVSTIDFVAGKTVVDVELMVADKVMKDIMEKKQQVTSTVKGGYLDMFPSATPFGLLPI